MALNAATSFELKVCPLEIRNWINRRRVKLNIFMFI
jgi:hypothetical protein